MKKIIIPADLCYKDIFVVVNIQDKAYVCPGWHELPIGTTRDQIEVDMSVIPIKKVTSTGAPKNGLYEAIVKGTRPGTEYVVKFDRGGWSCTCPAATFQRGDCKHVKAEQKNIKITA